MPTSPYNKPKQIALEQEELRANKPMVKGNPLHALKQDFEKLRSRQMGPKTKGVRGFKDIKDAV